MNSKKLKVSWVLIYRGISSTETKIFPKQSNILCVKILTFKTLLEAIEKIENGDSVKPVMSVKSALSVAESITETWDQERILNGDLLGVDIDDTIENLYNEHEFSLNKTNTEGDGDDNYSLAIDGDLSRSSETSSCKASVSSQSFFAHQDEDDAVQQLELGT